MSALETPEAAFASCAGPNARESETHMDHLPSRPEFIVIAMAACLSAGQSAHAARLNAAKAWEELLKECPEPGDCVTTEGPDGTFTRVHRRDPGLDAPYGQSEPVPGDPYEAIREAAFDRGPAVGDVVEVPGEGALEITEIAADGTMTAQPADDV